jgi:flagellar basal-body rod modification protein FlgD
MSFELAALGGTSPTTQTPAAETPPSSSEMSEFLRLLTAQIENQDPLEPLDANQFIEQLATINALEQQIATNGHLEEIVGLLRSVGA